MSDMSRGPRAMAVLLVGGLGAALVVARFVDPVAGAVIGAIAVALAVRAAMGEPERRVYPDVEDAPPIPPAPLAQAPVIGGTGFGAVFVEVSAGQLLVCVFPVARAEGAEELERLQDIPPDICGVVIFNDGPGVHLFGSRIVEALGVPDDRVWATDAARAIDRCDGDEAELRAQALPAAKHWGDTSLERASGHVGLCWGDAFARVTAVLGVSVPAAAVAESRPTYIVGNLDLADPMALGVDVIMTLKHAMLVEGEVPGSQMASARFLSALGVRATVLGHREPADVFDEWLDATREGGEAFEQRIDRTPVPLWIDVFTELAVTGEHALADERMEAIIARSPDHRLYFELGISKLLQDDPASAEPAFRSATELGSDIAWNSLANALARLDRLDEAIEAVTEGMTRMPDDPLTFKTAFGLHRRAGHRDAAAAIAVDGPWTGAQRRELRAMLDAEPERVVERFGGYAAIARDRAAACVEAGDLAGGEQLLRRAVELDPLMLDAWLDLASVLGKEENFEALAVVCQTAIDSVPGGDLLRFELGHLALRDARWQDARSSFEALLEVLPEHREARVNLVSALCALHLHAEAREHLPHLEEMGLSRDVLERLREQCMDSF